MRPELFRIEWRSQSLHVEAWTFFVVVGAIAGALWAVRTRRQRELVGKYVIEAALVLFVGGTIASLGTYALVYHTESPWRGMHSFGWIVGSGISIGVYARVRRLSFWGGLDVIVPSLLLASAIGRVGCLMKGCCHGAATAPPAGVFMRSALLGPGYYLPVQAILGVMDATLFLLLEFRLRRAATFRGQIATTGLIGYSAYRFAAEFLRIDPIQVAWLTATQLGCLVLGPVVLVVRRGLRREGHAPFRRLELGPVADR